MWYFFLVNLIKETNSEVYEHNDNMVSSGIRTKNKDAYLVSAYMRIGYLGQLSGTSYWACLYKGVIS